MHKVIIAYLLIIAIVVIAAADYYAGIEAYNFETPRGSTITLTCSSTNDFYKLSEDLGGRSWIEDNLVLNDDFDLDGPYEITFTYPSGVQHQVSKRADDSMRIWAI